MHSRIDIKLRLVLYVASFVFMIYILIFLPAAPTSTPVPAVVPQESELVQEQQPKPEISNNEKSAVQPLPTQQDKAPQLPPESPATPEIPESSPNSVTQQTQTEPETVIESIVDHKEPQAAPQPEKPVEERQDTTAIEEDTQIPQKQPQPSTGPEVPLATEAPDPSSEEADSGQAPEIESQPDETGSIVVDDQTNKTDISPLPTNAHLQVIGDGVYWLDSEYNVSQELEAVPEVGTLILLAPNSGAAHSPAPHIRTHILAAGLDDLTKASVDEFLYLTRESQRHPIIIANLPGALGALCFKGIYFLDGRGMDIEATLKNLENDLAKENASVSATITSSLRNFAESLHH